MPSPTSSSPRAPGSVPPIHLSKRFGLPLLLAAALFTVGCSVRLRNPEYKIPESPAATPSQDPALQQKTMVDQKGGPWSIQDIYRSAPVVVLFYRGHWWSWCKQQLGELSEGYKKIEGYAVRVVAISTDSPAETKKFAATIQAPFTLLADPQMQAIKHFGVLEADHDLAVPSVFVLDSQQEIIWKRIGESINDRVDFKTLDAVLGSLDLKL